MSVPDTIQREKKKPRLRRPQILSNGAYNPKSFYLNNRVSHLLSDGHAEALGVDPIQLRAVWSSPAILPRLEDELALTTVEQMREESEAGLNTYSVKSEKVEGRVGKIEVLKSYARFYVHNGGKFDMEFFLRSEKRLNDAGWYISVTRRKNVLYRLVFTKRVDKPPFVATGNESLADRAKWVVQPDVREYNLELRDSMLILPMGQSGLCKSFKVDTPKGTHPYSFVNPSNLYTEIESFAIPDSAWTLGPPDNLGLTINLFNYYREYIQSD